MPSDKPLPPLTDAEIEMLLHKYKSGWTYSAAAIMRLCRGLQAARETLQGIRDCPKISPDQFEIFARHVADNALGGSQ